MKRDASGRPVKESPEDRNQRGNKQPQRNPAEGNESPNAPSQEPGEARDSQKGFNQDNEAEIADGLPAR